ncbi:MAG: hypothetical protein GXO25_02620 [Euryarchaeota archaeon]|nr:hypothetical protein [Euryarchaeota archaeon]
MENSMESDELQDDEPNEYYDAPKNSEVQSPPKPTLIIIGLSITHIGVAMLVYSVYIGNSPLLFTVGSFAYPAGAIVLFAALIKYSKYLQAPMRTITIVAGVLILAWGIVGLVPVAHQIMNLILLQLSL